jgi:hypothetical protein
MKMIDLCIRHISKNQLFISQIDLHVICHLRTHLEMRLGRESHLKYRRIKIIHIYSTILRKHWTQLRCRISSTILKSPATSRLHVPNWLHWQDARLSFQVPGYRIWTKGISQMRISLWIAFNSKRMGSNKSYLQWVTSLMNKCPQVAIASRNIGNKWWLATENHLLILLPNLKI